MARYAWRSLGYSLTQLDRRDGVPLYFQPDPEAAPMPALHHDRRRQVLHHQELPAAHVPPVALQQERLAVARGGQPRPVVEDAAIAAIGVVPDRIAALRLRIFAVMRRQEAVAVD